MFLKEEIGVQTMEKIMITTEYITLVKLLKFHGFIGQGSDFHAFIDQNEVLVNDEVCDVKGKKLYPSTKVTINDISFMITSNEG